MPRGKTALKSATEADVVDSVHQSPTLEMKDIEPVAVDNSREELGTREPSKERELPNSVTDMAVDANTTSNKEEDSSLPRKPKRLVTITGSKSDAKPKKRADKTHNNKHSHASSPKIESPKKQRNKAGSDKTAHAKKKKKINHSYKQQFYDDDHSYEDPSLLVNNSTTRQSQPMNKQGNVAKNAYMDERATSPSVKASLSKSTESLKAAVKAVKENHSSLISETSIPRSIFAALVALLLSLIVFLAVYFLLHTHAILSTAVAILVYVVIFVTFGFMDGKRMKCLILLILPSVCSRGGRLALYLLLGYFVITGPLCNTIGHVKTVRNSLICINNERTEVVKETIVKFERAERCIMSKQLALTKMNRSDEVTCLQQRCSNVKDKFDQNCRRKEYRISPTACNSSQKLPCVNKTNKKDCPKKLLEKYCKDEFHEILEFLVEDTTDGDGCGFLEILSMLFPLLILFVLYEGYCYENNYRTYNSFHNFFLTGHFQVIDQKRSSCDRDAVLPLRKVELRKHVRPATVCNLTDTEKKQLWSNMKTYLLVLLVVLFVILADLYIFRMFDVENDEKVTSKNISNNVSDIVFNMNKTIMSNNKTMLTSNRTDNETNTTSAPKLLDELPVKTADICSANFDPPGSVSKIILPIILSLLLLVILLQAHVSRIQWYICSRLYKMHEKERVFYLYNKILEDRVQLVENCRKRMKCYHRETKTLDSLQVTRILSRQIGWLSKVFRFFHINLRRCIICNDTEKPEFKICHGLDCSGVYCLTCSFDIDKKCLYCDTILKHSLSDKNIDGKDSSKESLV